MSRHYAGAKPFKWLRAKLKIDKPYALGWGKWGEWEADLKAKRPVGYFLTETLPDILQWFPEHSLDYINDVRYYFVNRFVDKTHYLRTGLEPGKWHEFNERLLHGCFGELVDFVECEKAHHHMAWAKKEEKDKFKQPWWARGWIFRWSRWRSPECGVAHLQWEITLDQPDGNGNSSEHQAKAARETLLLYQWWTMVRPKREDPWVASGLRKFWDEMDVKYGEHWLSLGGKQKLTPAEERKYNKLSKAADKIEAGRDNEDTEMLLRLVNIRNDLWT